MSTGTGTGSVSDEEVLLAYPETRLDHLNVRFYAGLLRHELLANRCADCGTWAAQPRPLCPACWSTNVALTPVAGRGTVYMLTRLFQGPPATDVDYATPWPLAAVELAEQPGLRFAASIVDCPPERLAVGLPVELIWITRAGAPWYAFRPADPITEVSA
ncbi:MULTISPECIES: Zn-ribbon domain-containing OB-fold protein [unclassified Pseudofrankia]|uniref:Zn-ribbon domain-containing OB-fold protein n=1 Tax=unclassified Pseudofrankia TaxID=2994372 RepID=UPI0008DACDA9|nr:MULTISPECIES: OB-fold domain-containing protein [unclassified Pseudofrankia]MDT3441918.1 OB-fold domain-containing protein [Pseudofrankia sp. BMG5.37]OHV44562.1 hypothetical protein BCD48_25215 [Pseudofrankia sp. BMG5.36]